MYNGHFGRTCYRSLFLFNKDGVVERTLLRKGNVHSADRLSVLYPVIWFSNAHDGYEGNVG